MDRKQFVHCIWFTIVLALLFMPAETLVAQSDKSIDITLEALGYADDTVFSPYGTLWYNFYLPTGWEIGEGSYVSLTFDHLVSGRDAGSFRSGFFDVRFNDQYLYTQELSPATSKQIRVNLPREYFRLPEDSRNNWIRIGYSFEPGCDLDVQGRLVIKKTSLFHLVYKDRPLPLDLALFPKPIYSGSKFEQSQARVVLPNAFEESDVRTATVIAARLGQMTNGQLPVTATLGSQMTVNTPPGEHLIAVGKLDKNPLIGQLGKSISTTERRLALRSQMPMTVSVGSVMSYTLVVENTSASAENLIVEDRFSPGGKFSKCDGLCSQSAPNRLHWDIGLLAPGQQVSTTIALQVTSVVTPSLSLKHTATLMDSRGNILNVDTLATQIGDLPDNRLLQSPVKKSTRFFVQGSEAIAEDAGILQEIISPWNARRVAIIVTGLDDDAIIKAAYGLNPQYRLPGTTGPLAIVDDIRPISISAAAQQRDLTLAAIGYENRELDAFASESAWYSFDLPQAATQSETSYFALHFGHAAILSKMGGSIKVSLNGIPIGGAALDDSNLNDSWLRIPLSNPAIRPGSNQIRVQALRGRVEQCETWAGNPRWTVIYADSYLHFEPGRAETRFDLKNFPYPYLSPGDMSNLVFGLSTSPSLTEVDQLLHIAFVLGSNSQSKDLMPRVIFGQDSNVASVSGSNVIAIGLPKTNPFMRSANALLPQPFVPDTNDIFQKVDRPIYGILPGTDLGVIQQVVSPWSKGGNQAFLIAAGTTDIGVSWGVNALARSDSGLKGDLAIVRGDKVTSVDTRPVSLGEVFTGTVTITPVTKDSPTRTVTPSAKETPTPQQIAGQIRTPIPSTEYSQTESLNPFPPTWLIPLLVVSLMVFGVLAIVAVRRARS